MKKKIKVVLAAAVALLLTSCVPRDEYYPWENKATPVQQTTTQTTKAPPTVRGKNAKVLETKYTSKGVLVFLELPGNPEVPSDWAWAGPVYWLVLMKYSGSTSYSDATQTYSHYETAKKNFDAGRVRE